MEVIVPDPIEGRIPIERYLSDQDVFRRKTERTYSLLLESVIAEVIIDRSKMVLSNAQRQGGLPDCNRRYNRHGVRRIFKICLFNLLAQRLFYRL
jgi:hypothetical protein